MHIRGKKWIVCVSSSKTTFGLIITAVTHQWEWICIYRDIEDLKHYKEIKKILQRFCLWIFSFFLFSPWTHPVFADGCWLKPSHLPMNHLERRLSRGNEAVLDLHITEHLDCYKWNLHRFLRQDVVFFFLKYWVENESKSRLLPVRQTLERRLKRWKSDCLSRKERKKNWGVPQGWDSCL